jgi:hypothetical protein
MYQRRIYQKSEQRQRDVEADEMMRQDVKHKSGRNIKCVKGGASVKDMDSKGKGFIGGVIIHLRNSYRPGMSTD